MSILLNIVFICAREREVNYSCSCAAEEGNDWSGPSYCRKGKCDADKPATHRAIASAYERAARLPIDAEARKASPMMTGLLDYFPEALADVARLSKIGNDQHSPGEPTHWARSKSTDEADCIVRHLVDRGKVDTDGIRHSTKAAWRALASLQKEIECDENLPISRGSTEI